MNPYDKYSSDNQIPRLTDEVIRKRINENLRLCMTTMIMMLVCALLAVWVLTGMGFYLKDHTLAGNYPVIVWLVLVMIWLVAAGFIAYHVRDYLKDRAAYSGKYHVVPPFFLANSVKRHFLSLSLAKYFLASEILNKKILSCVTLPGFVG